MSRHVENQSGSSFNEGPSYCCVMGNVILDVESIFAKNFLKVFNWPIYGQVESQSLSDHRIKVNSVA